MTDVGALPPESARPNSAGRLSELLFQAIDVAAEHRWEPALRRAAAHSHLSVDEQVDAVVRSFQVELSGVGSLMGGMAAIPAAGTTFKLSTSFVDIGWATGRLADMILTIAAVHGHDWASVEDRRMWIVTVLAYGDGAAAVGSKLAAEAGKGLGKKATKSVSTKTLKKVNAAFGRTIVTKYGTKRGVIALGTALPFGIGAAIGGGANFLVTRSVGRHADAFMRSIAPLRPSDN